MEVKFFLRPLLFLAVVASFSCACRGGRSPQQTGGAATVPTRNQPVMYGYKVVNTYPHNTGSYTQGLYWHDGYLWEGTGQEGESALKKVELETGKVITEVPLDDIYFGEGIALLDGKIYQLTWQNQTGFIYDAATLKKTGEFRYRGEGWGLTTDGRRLYMSNGSHQIQVIDPDGFKQESVINVTQGRRRVNYLNELEWIEGKIWANVYGSESIYIIDPATGNVEGIVDFTDLLPANARTPGTDVFNGIAYDPDRKRIFVTGKNWSLLFEVETIQI